MEAIPQQGIITLKKIFQENWDKFLGLHYSLVKSYIATMCGK